MAKRGFVLFTCFLLLGGLALRSFPITLFSIREIKVEAESQEHAQDVKRRLHFLKGLNLLTLKDNRVLSVLAHDPNIRSLVIRKIFPDCILVHVEPQNFIAREKTRDLYLLWNNRGQTYSVSSVRFQSVEVPDMEFESARAKENWNREFCADFILKWGRLYPGPTRTFVFQDFPYVSVDIETPRAHVFASYETLEQHRAALRQLPLLQDGALTSFLRIYLLSPNKKAVVSYNESK